MNKLIIGVLLMSIALCGFGCVYQAGGGELYDATATTEEGKEFVKKLDVKYLCKEVYGIYWTDFHRTECEFAVDVNKTGDTISYNGLDQEAVKELGLKPNFTWWENFGMWVILIVLVVIVVFWIREKTSEEIAPEQPPPDAPIHP